MSPETIGTLISEWAGSKRRYLLLSGSLPRPHVPSESRVLVSESLVTPRGSHFYEWAPLALFGLWLLIRQQLTGPESTYDSPTRLNYFGV